MFTTRSRTMFASALIGSLYTFSVFKLLTSGVQSTDSTLQIVSALSIVVLIPHFALTVLAVIFNWVGFYLNKQWAAITCGTLYSVAGVIFMPMIVFMVPMIVLSFVGVKVIGSINFESN